jgi:hypothetical protein
MKEQTLTTKVAAGLSTVVLALAVSACSTHKLAAGTDSGEIRTEQSAQQNVTPAQAIGEAPAPANTQGAAATSTPAVISGPAKVDSTGRAYTSSSTGGSGNASAVGLNTDVNMIPKKANSTVTVTESPAPAVVVETAPAPALVEVPPPTAPVIVETPAPAPVVIETPAPAPVVIETPAPAPMISSTETTTTTHRRLRKD